MPELNRTPIYDLHLALGAKMVPFAGYEMPVQYGLGVMKEHLWTREHAGLFDVSHMGQVQLFPADGEDMDDLDFVAEQLETLVPVDIVNLKPGRQRYALFTDDNGAIIDDLMVARRDHLFHLVVNAARKDVDLEVLTQLHSAIEIEPLRDSALLALQGPDAEVALSRLAPAVAEMRFMDFATHHWKGVEMWVSRSGYTGEDGFEISVEKEHAVALAEALLAMEEVEPIGLGARDSLRLEAGLCLYGNDIDTTTTPVEAALEWAIQKARREGDRAGGFPGADIILDQLANGAPRRRVGLLPEGRAPMRDGTELFAGETKVGHVTSGAYGPSLERPISMGYVAIEYAETGTKLDGEVRGKRMPVTVADMPFRPPNYKR